MLSTQTFSLEPARTRAASRLSQTKPGSHPIWHDDQPGLPGSTAIGCCYMGDTFYLGGVDVSRSSSTALYSRQEDYIKFHLRLAGRSVTVLDGFGEHEFDGPELFLLSAPPEMAKVDLYRKNIRRTFVSFCVRRTFFPMHLGIDPEELPQPVRSMVLPEETHFAAHSAPLSPTLAAAARSLLWGAFSPPLAELYYPAKAIELMSLLIGHFAELERRGLRGEIRRPGARDRARLHEAREWLAVNYAESVTLAEIAKRAGLSRTALTHGFRQLFGLSVFDFVQNVRMQAAWGLLQEGAGSVTEVAQTVGYGHSGNFSVAFKRHFGCLPKAVRH